MSTQNIKKKARIRDLIKKNQKIFKCPVCSEPMTMNEYSLICKSKHCFDLAKKGYINLLTSSYVPVYSKELFAARHKICEIGFYGPLINKLGEIIEYYRILNNKKEIKILDAGCGEGSHTYELFKPSNEKLGYTFIGADISKDSINIAASNNADIIWCVADLARLPFQDKSFNIILNILSPANYAEFHRILNDEGIVVKVVPGAQYLQELRAIIFKDRDKVNYSNSRVINYFKQRLEVIDIQNISYKYTVEEQLLPYLIEMTPLTWGTSAENINDILKSKLPFVTVDLTLIVGEKRGK